MKMSMNWNCIANERVVMSENKMQWAFGQQMPMVFAIDSELVDYLRLNHVLQHLRFRIEYAVVLCGQ